MSTGQIGFKAYYWSATSRRLVRVWRLARYYWWHSARRIDKVMEHLDTPWCRRICAVIIQDRHGISAFLQRGGSRAWVQRAHTVPGHVDRASGNVGWWGAGTSVYQYGSVALAIRQLMVLPHRRRLAEECGFRISLLSARWRVGIFVGVRQDGVLYFNSCWSCKLSRFRTVVVGLIYVVVYIESSKPVWDCE